jgi:transposase InsO family protein
MHRKAAIRLLGGVRPLKAGRRPRRRKYGPELADGLREVWEVADRMCGKLLVAAMPALLEALGRHGELRLAATERKALLQMSAATMDRLLRPARRAIGRQPRRKSPATTGLKAQVPVRTWSEWGGVKPGSLQADLVLHCGESVEGFYLTTLTAVDVATGWTELQAVWGMGKERVGSAVHRVRQKLPFALRELHTDNGSEFLNYTLHAWCLKEKIDCTRGRSYKKNDQAYVEQKNWLNVRRHVGYDHYSSKEAYEVMQQLYSLLGLYGNFFRPVRKTVAKERIGSKIVKRYDRPLTPYQRVLAAGCLSDAGRKELASQYLALNPASLQRRIETTLRRLWSLASHTIQDKKRAG